MSGAEPGPDARRSAGPTGPQPLTDLHAPVEIALRLGAIFLLAAWCLWIVAPFLGIVAWALIIAIAADDPHAWLTRLLGGRRRAAAAILVVVGFAVLVVPAVMLIESLLPAARRFAELLASEGVAIPPPPPQVSEWPLVGSGVSAFWQSASENLTAVLAKLVPQLRAVSVWLLGAARSAGVALLQFAGSIVIAGIVLSHGESRSQAIARVMTRLAGERGPDLAELAQSTTRSVVQGILGVAAAQSVLAGVGFMVAGVPGAGLWALLVLVSAIVQLPVLIVMIPPVLIVYSHASGIVAGAFVAWCIAVSLVDNVLKPLLFGRGVRVPMVVIFIGAVGGMLTMGIIGLFLGAVVLALGYELGRAWLDEQTPVATAGSSASPPGA